MALLSSRYSLFAMVLGSMALGASATTGCSVRTSSTEQTTDPDVDSPSKAQRKDDDGDKAKPSTLPGNDNGPRDPADTEVGTNRQDAGADASARDAGTRADADTGGGGGVTPARTIAELFDTTKTPDGKPVALDRMVVTASGDVGIVIQNNVQSCVSSAVVQDPACTTPPCGMALRESKVIATCIAANMELTKLAVGAVVDVRGTMATDFRVRFIDVPTARDTGARATIMPLAIADIASFADVTFFAKYAYTLVRAEVSPARTVSRSVIGTTQSSSIALSGLLDPRLYDPGRVSLAIEGSLVSRVTGVAFYKIIGTPTLRVREAADTVVQ